MKRINYTLLAVVASLALTVGTITVNYHRARGAILDAWSQMDGHRSTWESYGHRMLRKKRDDCTVLVVRIKETP